MKKISIIFCATLTMLLLSSCKTVNEKLDRKISKEEKELSKWLNQEESELKIVFGNPDKIEFTENRTKYYIYTKEKLKIKCERKFEIDQQNIIVGFSSRNCF